MGNAKVPQSMDELVDDYGRLIWWTVHQLGGHVQILEHEREDLVQAVYLAIQQRNFLARCRAYYQTHAGVFSTSLVTLIRNVVINHVRKEGRRRARYVSDPGPRHGVTHGFASHPDPIRFEDYIIAKDQLAKLEQGLVRKFKRRHLSASTLIATGLEVGPHPEDIGERLRVPEGTIRNYFMLARQTARRHPERYQPCNC